MLLEKIEDLLKEVDGLKAQNAEDVEKLRLKYLSKKGEINALMADFRQQIPAGLNYMATGNPYWTVDVGSFFTRDDGHRWFYKGEFPGGVNDEAYREYYVRCRHLCQSGTALLYHMSCDIRYQF